MKKQYIFLFLPLLFSLVGCTDASSTARSIGRHYIITEIDGCEYIVWGEGAGNSKVATMTHKGNCKACVAREASHSSH